MSLVQVEGRRVLGKHYELLVVWRSDAGRSAVEEYAREGAALAARWLPSVKAWELIEETIRPEGEALLVRSIYREKTMDIKNHMDGVEDPIEARIRALEDAPDPMPRIEDLAEDWQELADRIATLERQVFCLKNGRDPEAVVMEAKVAELERAYLKLRMSDCPMQRLAQVEEQAKNIATALDRRFIQLEQRMFTFTQPTARKPDVDLVSRVADLEWHQSYVRRAAVVALVAAGLLSGIVFFKVRDRVPEFTTYTVQAR